MSNSNSSHYSSFKSYPSECISLQCDSIFRSHNCETHQEKNLNLICTYPFCAKKGLICLLCQHQDHLTHTQYCLPWEIFLENIEKHRSNDKFIVMAMKKKIKAVNNGTKKILRDFLKKTKEVCDALSQEIDRNVDREIKLMEQIFKKDREMCHDFKSFDEHLEVYKTNLTHHLEKIKVEITVEKAEKIKFVCQDTEGFLYELHDLAEKSRKFEDYLRGVLGSLGKEISNIYVIDYFNGDSLQCVKTKNENNEEINTNDAGMSTQNTLNMMIPTQVVSQIIENKTLSLRNIEEK